MSSTGRAPRALEVNPGAPEGIPQGVASQLTLKESAGELRFFQLELERPGVAPHNKIKRAVL